MKLSDTVVSMLDADGKGTGIDAALGLIAAELGVNRISLHSIDARNRCFEVAGGGGEGILAAGTKLPLQVSTQVAVPGRGGVFRCPSFKDVAFEMPMDRLVEDLGFRSGCSLPLFIGSRPVGAMCISSRETDLDCDPLLDVLSATSSAVALALHSASVEVVPRIVICHDDRLTSEGLARVLEHSCAVDVEVCATLEDAVEHAEAPDAAGLTMICDTSFAGIQIDCLLTLLRSAGAGGGAIVFASSNSPMDRMLAMRSGVAGYIPRADGPLPVVRAVRNLIRGRATGFELTGAEPGSSEGRVARLTQRESEVLCLLEQGLRFKQIALRLGISESTAKGYARNLFAKLDAHSRGEAVFAARAQGLLDARPNWAPPRQAQRA